MPAHGRAGSGQVLAGPSDPTAKAPICMEEAITLLINPPATVGVAIGETVILLHPPSPFSRCFNMDGEGVSVK